MHRKQFNFFGALLFLRKSFRQSLIFFSESIDVNNNGRIMYTEFLAATVEAHGHIEERRIAEAFDRMDSDDSGYISKANMKELLGKDFTNEAFNEMLRAADTDGDGKISYPEFLALFRQQHHKMAEQAGNDVVDDSTHASEANLVGLEAEIPGGKFDTQISDLGESNRIDG